MNRHVIKERVKCLLYDLGGGYMDFNCKILSTSLFENCRNKRQGK